MLQYQDVIFNFNAGSVSEIGILMSGDQETPKRDTIIEAE